MGAKVTCILDKHHLSRNQVTVARKRGTSKRAPSEPVQSVFFTLPSLSFDLPLQERHAKQLAPSELLQGALFSTIFPYTTKANPFSND